MRWRLADNEAKFRRNLAEDDAEEDFFSTLTESRLGDWDDSNVTPIKEEESFEKPGTPASKSRTFLYSSSSKISQKKDTEPKNDLEKVTTPSKSVNLSRSSSARVEPTSSFANPVYNHVGEEGKLKQTQEEAKESKAVSLEKVNDKNYYR